MHRKLCVCFLLGYCPSVGTLQRACAGSVGDRLVRLLLLSLLSAWPLLVDWNQRRYWFGRCCSGRMEQASAVVLAISDRVAVGFLDTAAFRFVFRNALWFPCA